ncbi:UDP-N-acetylglucosamine--N-acetylmuramyl-(pentapeptide) pyrophosphoryl-undecaprenol N-acetylglucosamine transferase [Candidatus Nomurabacteria bacterium]|nr:UDP-N-acetylglucosamine--N-acetylmuramyl-(pentapeptide) pyrophosphoryl-undecaprenol N-acetylglucosamine transferase [Candidatus Nomurabacteria bacterium]USN94906.1 MAG: UDP-N-acetylglucosamine--N-acetylmuramyl-(pentapeptide) pyrophosphoryl-undecaprenol N-acetylglucosamine transferase [Candidatus Nomurabacteria bacterium]
MRILFAGGGTGGHFYPIIAVAEELNALADKEKIIELKLHYASTEPYDNAALLRNGIKFEQIYAGKVRIYFSPKNIIDIFKTFVGFIKALGMVYRLYPDVVFSKGGYASVPTVLAARILGIPVIIHDSDSVPGRANLFAGKFAKRIALSFESAASYFKHKDRIAITGQPVRRDLREATREGAYEHFDLDPTKKTILIFCGSQGAQKINDIVLDTLPHILKEYQVIHQTGDKNKDIVMKEAKVILGKDYETLSKNYKVFGFLNTLSTKLAGGIADVSIARAGSSIFELSLWGVPSILIPITSSNGDHQRKNAYAVARTGGAVVIEEANMKDTIIISEIERILKNETLHDQMSRDIKHFATPDSAGIIAGEILRVALDHEK